MDVFDKLVSFKIGEELFAASINNVKEIIKMTDIVEVPKSPKFVRGVINLRGKIIPVIDLNIKFEVSDEKDISKSRIIISEIGNILIGFIVDAVLEVFEAKKDEFEEAPSLVSGESQKFIRGVVKKDGQMIMVIDINKVLSEEETGMLKEVN